MKPPRLILLAMLRSVSGNSRGAYGIHHAQKKAAEDGFHGLRTEIVRKIHVRLQAARQGD